MMHERISRKHCQATETISPRLSLSSTVMAKQDLSHIYIEGFSFQIKLLYFLLLDNYKTLDDHFGLLVLISIVQISNKFLQNLTRPLQCYTKSYARYIKSRNKHLLYI